MSKKHTLVRSELLRSKELSTRTKLVLITLISYYNEDLGYAYPSYEILLKNTRIDKSTLTKELMHFSDNGYIRIENGVGRRRNKYYISDHCLV